MGKFIISKNQQAVPSLPIGKINDHEIRIKALEENPGGGSLTVKEADGTPTATNVDTIVFTNGTVTDDGSGQVTVSITGGGSGHTIQEEGSDLTQRTNLNFIGGNITATDNPGNDATDVTFTAGGSDTALQYNNNGDIAGIATSSAFTDGTDLYVNGTTFHYFKTGAALTQNFNWDLSALSDIRQITLRDTSGTMALLGDNISDFTNDVGFVDGSGTTNELPYWVDSNTLGSLTTATYPSLTELSYVKGVTSAIQTQLDSKLDSSEYADATVSQTNTGTATDLYVSPDGLAGSYAGTKSERIYTLDANYLVTTGDGKAEFVVTPDMVGMNLVACGAIVRTTSSSGTPTIQLSRGRQANATTAHAFVDMLSTRITIDVGEYDSQNATTPAVIDTSNDDLALGDIIRVDIDTAGTGTKGLHVWITARLP